MLSEPEFVSSDVLVIGGGGAGLRAAIAAREKGASVLLVSKAPVGLGNNTALSKAGFAAATGESDAHDNPEVHIKDTLEAGHSLNERCLVEKMVRGIVAEVPFLEKCGVLFEKEGNRRMVSRVAGHSYPRQLHAKKRQGTSLTLPLKEYASRAGVSFMEKVFVSRLLTRGGEVVGAVGIDREGRLLVFQARAVVLATGGLGQIYLYTNNAVGATGDGYALAFHIGIPLRDMEFVQFYPTAIRGTRLLPYETFILRCGSALRNSKGEDVLVKYGLQDPMAMTRDCLARAIMKETMEKRDVIIDIGPVSRENLPFISGFLPAGALPGRKEFIVSPTAHFGIGGVITDEEARPRIARLFACGEVVGGLHGANRLAGNALAECFVMGRVAGENAAMAAHGTPPKQPDRAEVTAEKVRLESMLGEEKGNLSGLIHSLKELTWFQAGIIRHQKGLKEALGNIREFRSLAARLQSASVKDLTRQLELDNMLLVSEMVVLAALERKESRGAHYREDFPGEEADWLVNLIITNKKGEIKLEKKPASTSRK